MKKIKYILYLAVIGFLFAQCNSEDDLLTKDAKEGGLVTASAVSMNYVVGNTTPYAFSLYVNQGDVKVSKIELHKSFYAGAVPWTNPDDTSHHTADSIPAAWSNEVLQETINVTSATSTWIDVTPLYYADLTANLTIDGDPLPASDGDLHIGDYFNFVVKSILSDGRVVSSAYSVKMTVSTRFAGKYKCVFGEYYRIHVLTYTTSDWPAETQIESVDAKTYKVIEYWGAFEGNEWYFQIQGDGTITYPEGQKFNSQPMITLESNPADMTEVNVAGTNSIVKDDVNGKDQLKMSIGYYTPNSGPRTMYQVMEKIVE